MKEHLLSALNTFIAGFAIAIYPLLNDLSLENLSKAALLAVIFAGVRAGVKALIEYLFINNQSGEFTNLS